MKHQLLSILTGLSVALATMAAFAAGNDGSRAPKNNCDPKKVDDLWRTENEKLKDKFRDYYRDKSKYKMAEDVFCESIFTEAGFCGEGGECGDKSKHKPALNQEDGRAIQQAAEQSADDGPVPPRYRGDEPRVVEKIVYRDRPVPAGGGGGFGDLFNGNPMGYMLAGGLGGLIGAMLAGNNNNNNNMMMRPPMFRAPYGPYGPMGPGGMMGNRPPPYMPYNRAGAAPGIIGAGGAFAPGVISPYNGATIYNGGYMGSAAGAYFQTPPAVINATTGMRMYSVGGATTTPQYHLLGN